MPSRPSRTCTRDRSTEPLSTSQWSCPEAGSRPRLQSHAAVPTSIPETRRRSGRARALAEKGDAIDARPRALSTAVAAGLGSAPTRTVRAQPHGAGRGPLEMKAAVDTAAGLPTPTGPALGRRRPGSAEEADERARPLRKSGDRQAESATAVTGARAAAGRGVGDELAQNGSIVDTRSTPRLYDCVLVPAVDVWRGRAMPAAALGSAELSGAC